VHALPRRRRRGSSDDSDRKRRDDGGAEMSGPKQYLRKPPNADYKN